MVVTHFIHAADQPWLHSALPQHSFEVVPAPFRHDSSRKRTGGREWLDLLLHAARSWLAAKPWRWRAMPTGFVTAFPPLAVGLGLIKRLTGSRAPIVAWYFNLSRNFTGWQGRLARFALARVDVFVVSSRREIAAYAAMLGLPQDRFVFVPFAEDMLPTVVPEDAESPFVLAMGTANRDYDTLLAAVGTLGLRTVIVAGRHAMAGKALPPGVEVRSGLSRDDCNRLCQQARINVVPLDTSDTASGQVTLWHAMMFGKAVVATAGMGTEDYIQDGETGALVPPSDPAALAAAIGALWADEPRRLAMGRAAQAWIALNASDKTGPIRLGELLDTLRPVAPALAGNGSRAP